MSQQERTLSGSKPLLPPCVVLWPAGLSVRYVGSHDCDLQTTHDGAATHLELLGSQHPSLERWHERLHPCSKRPKFEAMHGAEGSLQSSLLLPTMRFPENGLGVEVLLARTGGIPRACKHSVQVHAGIVVGCLQHQWHTSQMQSSRFGLLLRSCSSSWWSLRSCPGQAGAPNIHQLQSTAAQEQDSQCATDEPPQCCQVEASTARCCQAGTSAQALWPGLCMPGWRPTRRQKRPCAIDRLFSCCHSSLLGPTSGHSELAADLPTLEGLYK